MNDSRVLSCHHYKIIAVLRYAIAGYYARIIKKQVGSRQGAARDKNGKPELVEKTRTPPGPGHIVNLCFIVVLLFSTLLTWREVVVLEDAYISSKRNHLENVANALDKHLQYNVDKLIFCVMACASLSRHWISPSA
ncbi:hypothetical protein ACNKHM_24110 [Shigella sonnei]